MSQVYLLPGTFFCPDIFLYKLIKVYLKKIIMKKHPIRTLFHKPLSQVCEELYAENNLDPELLLKALKDSLTYVKADMAFYLLNDEDKLPMSLVDQSKLVNNDYEELIDRCQTYFMRVRTEAIGLLAAVENELAILEEIHNDLNALNK